MLFLKKRAKLQKKIGICKKNAEFLEKTAFLRENC